MPLFRNFYTSRGTPSPPGSFPPHKVLGIVSCLLLPQCGMLCLTFSRLCLPDPIFFLSRSDIYLLLIFLVPRVLDAGFPHDIHLLFSPNFSPA